MPDDERILLAARELQPVLNEIAGRLGLKTIDQIYILLTNLVGLIGSCPHDGMVDTIVSDIEQSLRPRVQEHRDSPLSKMN